jgi:hypothetical protein
LKKVWKLRGQAFKTDKKKTIKTQKVHLAPKMHTLVSLDSCFHAKNSANFSPK